MHGRLEVTARSLSRFAALAGGALKGEAHLTADLDGAPRYGALTATVDAHATNLTTAYPMLDRVTGGDLRLTGAARATPGGGFGFTDLMASGAHGSARLNGDFGRDKVDLNASVDVPQASVLDPRVSGKAEIAATLTGVPDDLNAAVKATLSDGRLLDRKTSGLTLEAQATHITGQIEANATASGDIDGHQLQGSAHIAKTGDGGWRVDNLALSLASAKLAGNVAIGSDQLANGEVSFSAANLDDLSPLVLTRMSGALQAKVSASAAGGRQAVAIVASSDRMTFGANRFEGLKIDLNIGDLWGARSVSGVARLARAEVAGQTISDAKLTATGRGDLSDLDFTGSVFGFALKAQRPADGRAADPARPRGIHRATQRSKDRSRRAGCDHLRQQRTRHRKARPAASIPAACRSRATPGPRLTSARRRPPCRSRRSISFRRASALREPPTARRRSAERRPIRPATGASG